MPAKRKREGELARPRERKGASAAPPAVLGTMRPVTIPAANKDWHPIAKRLYNAYKTSGQSDRWQNSDWAFAVSLMDDLSRFKIEEQRRDEAIAAEEIWRSLTEEEREAQGFDPKRAPHIPKGGSAMKMVTIMSALERLGTTEADRLKVRIELTEPESEADDAEVIAIQDYQTELGLVEGGVQG